MSEVTHVTASSNSTFKRITRIFARLSAIGLAILVIALIFTVLLPKFQAEDEAETFLKTACITEPGGRILPTIIGGNYRYQQYPQVHHDATTGEKKMSGYIYALDARRIRGFKVADIKFIQCPAEFRR
jgi:hypothetical protein